jgi:hypothetical protein
MSVKAEHKMILNDVFHLVFQVRYLNWPLSTTATKWTAAAPSILAPELFTALLSFGIRMISMGICEREVLLVTDIGDEAIFRNPTEPTGYLNTNPYNELNMSHISRNSRR